MNTISRLNKFCNILFDSKNILFYFCKIDDLQVNSKIDGLIFIYRALLWLLAICFFLEMKSSFLSDSVELDVFIIEPVHATEALGISDGCVVVYSSCCEV